MKLKYFLEALFGFIITTPLLQESIRTVSNYDNFLLIYKILFSALFHLIEIAGYLVLIDGLSKLFFEEGIIELIQDFGN